LKKNGYTLVELALVVFLLGLMLTLAVPKVRENLLSDGLKSTERRLIGAIRQLRADAVREQVDYVLALDLDSPGFWTYSQDMTPEKRDEMRKKSVQFPAGVKIKDVSQLGLENKPDGEIVIKFYRQGHIQPTVIHLAQEERFATIVLSPFLSNLKVYDTYAEITPEGMETE